MSKQIQLSPASWQSKQWKSLETHISTETQGKRTPAKRAGKPWPRKMSSGPVSSWGSNTDSAALVQLLLGAQQCLRQLAPSHQSLYPGHNLCQGITTPISQTVSCHRGQPSCDNGTKFCLAAHGCFGRKLESHLSLLPFLTLVPLRPPDVCTCLQTHSWPPLEAFLHSGLPPHPQIECKSREARGLCGQCEGL